MLNRIRAAVRARLLRVVDEVVTDHHNELKAALTTHHQEFTAAGMALEFGVYTGRTLKVIASARKNKQVFGSTPSKACPRIGDRTYRRARSGLITFPMFPALNSLSDGSRTRYPTSSKTIPSRWHSCTWTQTCTPQRPLSLGTSVPGYGLAA